MVKLKKSSITKYKQRRDILDISRFLLFMFLIYALVNGIGIMRFDIEGMHTFLKYFNQVIMWGTFVIIIFLDSRRYNILNYGKLFVKRGASE